ncbi:TPA: hypothetical protein ACPZHF_004328 [Enterobacter cloacae subsp. cloacae]|uniref:hypothetical protein n=1 Tax=Enterobacter cloacae TaxID=550 RepID=UPI0021C20266|nr:hypothetical protein [Enterobacter cloacae]UXL11517.1 hypothetical protein N7S94_06035 [Enterobacter cloacae]HCT2372333.1 hypothetical protein [Enterobacter cloacae]HDS3501908.1 hypothetical protein [Enterobacter cloacae]
MLLREVAVNPYSPEKFPMARQVCEEFVIMQTAKHRQPIYRSEFGDILIDADCLASMLTSYFMTDNMDADAVEMKFFRMLDIYNPERPSYFASIGKYEGIKPSGIAVIEDILDYYAQKVADGELPAH